MLLSRVVAHIVIIWVNDEDILREKTDIKKNVYASNMIVNVYDNAKNVYCYYYCLE
jgi:hypothetical protein